MKRKLKLVLLFYTVLFLVSLLEAYGYAEKYDEILAQSLLTTGPQNHEIPGPPDFQTPELKDLGASRLNKLPDLNGIWILTKKTTKRKINPVLSKPVSLTNCNSRMPFEKRDFKKEVVIYSPTRNFFTIRSLYPVTNDIYCDPNQNIDITYENFGFKGVIDPKDLTYAYTLKVYNHVEHPSLARQLWFNGRLKYDSVSSHKITATGYEVEATPECEGFILDEVKFEFKKTRSIELAKNRLDDIQYSALYNRDISQIETALPKAEFEGERNNYKPVDTTKLNSQKTILVPGLD